MSAHEVFNETIDWNVQRSIKETPGEKSESPGRTNNVIPNFNGVNSQKSANVLGKVQMHP